MFKATHLAILAALCSAPLLADAPLNPHSLGMMEGSLSACASTDAAEAAKYQAHAAAITRGFTAQELAKMRDTAMYKEAYDQTASALGQAAPEELRRTCSELLGHKEGFTKPAR